MSGMNDGNKRAHLSNGTDANPIDDVVSLIQEQMNRGVGAMRFKASDHLTAGEARRSYHFGRMDSAAEWMNHTGVSEHDILDNERNNEKD